MRARFLVPASLLLIVLAASLAACGGGSDDGSTARASGDDIPTATLPNPLPDVRVVGQATVAAPGDRYIVQAGDNPSSIAERFGITTEALLEANGIVDPAGLYVGQELIIPGVDDVASFPTPVPPTEAPAETPAPIETPAPTSTGQQVYIVQDGDIPETIAAQFGITADQLMAANGITDSTSLYIGQELIIPTPVP